MLVILGLIIAFVLIAVFSNRATRQCRWREYPRGETATWVCVQCGEQIEGKRGKAPQTCLRNHSETDG
ncbi:hypothetical protein ACOXXX_13770 [Thalassococcus sp. BH17M4-6]|uniref:hypothetical protein n=1 Tax=Thalassococcus sp. BH17M4-6 TaxID=3413148 RepID=UPI003BDC025B